MISNLDRVLIEIKDKCNIVDVIGSFIKLKRTGQNYQGLCPFHIEKTPSFNVNEKKGLYHCFGCGVGGDVINFIMRYQNVEFLEAVEILASKYGINVEKKEKSVQNYKSLYDIHENFAKLANDILFSEKGRTALAYLNKRGINRELIEMFTLGYISETQDFSKILSLYDIKTIKESGLFIIKSGSYISRFNGRIVIPIRNSSGKIVAFSGRSIHGEQPKYINSPETNIFKKRETLFNLDRAKKESNKSLFLVEGYFDVIALERYGFTPTVCTMGTSLSLEHVKILKRFFDEVVLIFDGDNAGKMAAIRSLDIFIKGDFIPSVIFLPNNEDPDSLLQNSGAEAFKEYINKKEDLFISVVKEEYKCAKKNINKKVHIIEKFKEKLMAVTNPYRKSMYIKEVAAICEIDEKLLLRSIDLNKSQSIINKKSTGILKYICEKDFLRALFELSEDVVQSLLSDLDEDYFNDKYMKKIFKKIIENLEKGINIYNLVRDNEVGNIVSLLIMNNQNNQLDQDYYIIAIQNKNKIVYNYLNKKKKTMLLSLSEETNEKERRNILESLNQLINKQKELHIHLLEE